MRFELKDIPLFDGIAEAHFQLFEHNIHTFDPGENIIDRGDPPKHIVVILSGEIKVHVNNVHLVTRKRHEIVGEQAFINRASGAVHSATCTVGDAPLVALCLSAEVVTVLLNDSRFVDNLLLDLSNKLRGSTEERYVRYGSAQLLFSEFRSHVSDRVRDELLDQGLDYGRPQYVENAVVLFADIRGFTATSLSIKALDVADQLSAYFSAVTDLIHSYDGFVDKFIGDAIMVIWGYPGVQERRSNDEILQCALEMNELASRYELGGSPIAIGIGINAGKVFMGNVGSKGKRQYTVLGAPVNLASRLEAKARDIGTPVVAGTDFFTGLSPRNQLTFEKHVDQKIKGVDDQTIYGLKLTPEEK